MLYLSNYSLNKNGMNHPLLPSLKKTVRFLPLVICLVISSQLFAQKNAPVAGDAALLTDLLKKDYNTLEPDVRREQLAKDRTIVIGTLKRYLTEGQQDGIGSNADKLVETSFLDYKKAEQELALYNNKFSKDTEEINKIKELVATSNSCKNEYQEKRYLLDKNTLDKLVDIFKTDNQYLSYISDEFRKKYDVLQKFQEDSYAEASQESSVQKALPFIGGDLAFEVIIDGLSKFLAERIKEELTVAVIERVQDYLRNPSENDPLAELKVLLPRTQEYLLSFKASQMVNFPDEIKQYLEDDLKHLPENLGDLGQTPRIRRLVEQYPELDFAVEALEFIPNLSKIKNPVDFFDLLENSRNISRWAQDETKPVQFNLANTLKLSSLLAHSLTVVDNGELRMAGADFLNAYGSEVPFYLMYVGFLHQQDVKYYHVEFKPFENITLCSDNTATSKTTVEIKNRILFNQYTGALMEKFKPENLHRLKDNIDFFSQTFNRIGGKAEKIYISAQAIKKARKSGDTLEAGLVYTYIDDIINLTEEISVTTDTLVSFLISHSGSYFCTIEKKNIVISRKTVNEYFGLEDRLTPYLSVARKTNELVYDLQQKKYATAIIKALELTTDIRGTQLAPELEYLKSMMSIFPDADGLKRIRINDTLNDLWDAKNWSAVLTAIKDGKAFEVVKHKKRDAEIILKELQKARTYAINNNLVYTPDFWDGFNYLITEVSNIAFEMKFSNEFSKAQNFLLNNSDFKKLILSYYTDNYLEELVDKVKSEMEHTGFFKPNEVTEVTNAINTYADEVFNYLVERDRKKYNTATETFTKTILKYMCRIPLTQNFHLNPQTIQIIHFINDMAKAENSDDVKEAIQAFALPAGSYSLKRQQKFTLSVNSYPGVLASIETTWTNNKPYNTFSPSFTAPVGLNLCWGAPKGMSHSVFVPVIDVGAFTRMYIGGKSIDSTSTTDSIHFTTLPEFSFMNLFSPGIYYSLGFRKTPLSLYAGFQWGPYLREVKKEDGEIKTINNYNSMRLSVGLVLDIPLWNIHSRSRL